MACHGVRAVSATRARARRLAAMAGAEPAPGPHDIEIPGWVREVVCVGAVWAGSVFAGKYFGFLMLDRLEWAQSRIEVGGRYCSLSLQIQETCSTMSCVRNKIKLQREKMNQMIECAQP